VLLSALACCTETEPTTVLTPVHTRLTGLP
jgi:hypothetical protein